MKGLDVDQDVVGGVIREEWGIGSHMLHMVEEYEISQGIFHSHLETMQFQAREFYKDHCYLVFVSLENKPNPHTWYYIKKDLLPNSDQ